MTPLFVYNNTCCISEQVILFISDGSPTQGQDPRIVIREENMKLQNKVIIFTYLLGPGK